MASDDRELLERIQDGDGESFGKLYDRTRGWLLSCVIAPRVGRADAEDVLSETFQVALTQIADFEWRGVGLLHWLAAIARRKAQEHVRRRCGPCGEAEPLPLLELPDDAPTAEAEMIRGETLVRAKERVAATMAKLHPRYAEALRLRLIEERPRPECAERLAVSPATFDVLFYRATRAFQREWSRP